MNRNSNLAAIALALCATALGGCATSSKTTAPTPPPAAAAQSSFSNLSGKVVETMNAGGYTYICIENGGKKQWAAVPTTDVTVGQQVSVQPGMEMKNFPSKSLNRTFDSIIFSGGMMEEKAATAPAGKAGAASGEMPAGHPPMGGKAAPSAAVKTDAKPAEGADLPDENKVASGKVVEVLSSGGYTYINLEQDGKTSWYATPPVQVKAGDEVQIKPGTQMGAFTSKTLKRTFNNIIFSPGVVVKK